MGDQTVSKSGEVLSASAIGSCLAITLFDAKHNVGAMAHAAIADHIPLQVDKIIEGMRALGRGEVGCENRPYRMATPVRA